MRKTFKGTVNGPILETSEGYVYTLFHVLDGFDGKRVLITIEEYKEKL